MLFSPSYNLDLIYSHTSFPSSSSFGDLWFHHLLLLYGFCVFLIHLYFQVSLDFNHFFFSLPIDPGTISSPFPYIHLLCFIVFAMVNIECILANMMKELDGGDPSSSSIFENSNALNVGPLEVNRLNLNLVVLNDNHGFVKVFVESDDEPFRFPY